MTNEVFYTFCNVIILQHLLLTNPFFFLSGFFIVPDARPLKLRKEKFIRGGCNIHDIFVFHVSVLFKSTSPQGGPRLTTGALHSLITFPKCYCCSRHHKERAAYTVLSDTVEAVQLFLKLDY